MRGNSFTLWGIIILYILVAVLYGANLLGYLFDINFVDHISQTAYYLSPHWSFYLVGLVGYLGLGWSILSYIKEDKAGPTAYSVMFERRVVGFLSQLLILLVLWLLIFSKKHYLIAMILTVVMTRSSVGLVFNISRSPDLRDSDWKLKSWAGIMAGWVFGLCFINIASYLNSIGLHSTGWPASIWGLIIVLLMTYMSVNTHIKYANQYITYANTWIIFSMMINHWPSSEFKYQNNIMFLGLIIIFFLTRGIYQVLENIQKRNKNNNA